MIWFAQMVKLAIENRNDENGRGGAARLSQETNIPKNTLIRWAEEENPNLSFSKACQLIKQLGGDFHRALPNWTPEFENNETIPVEGQVAAGQVTLCGESKNEIPVSAKVWRKSQYYSLTSGSVILLEVVGDSMFPDYRHGEYIACRAPRDHNLLQTGTPCVFQEGDGFTFKILKRTQRGDIIGQPINNHHDLVIFDKERLRIPYVVLGKIDPGK